MLAWLKKWWWALVGLLGAVMGVIIGASFKKTPIITGVDPEKKAAEDEAQKKALEAAQERDEQKKDATDAAADSEKKLIDTEKKRVELLEADPEALNDFLKQVGKDTRGPQ